MKIRGFYMTVDGNFDIRPNSLFSDLTSHFPTSSTGREHLPTRLKKAPRLPDLIVKRQVDQWPDMLDTLPCYNFIVSEKVASCFSDVPTTQAQIFPLNLVDSRRKHGTPKYFLLNVCKAIDAAHLAECKVSNEIPPDKEVLHFQFRRYGEGRVIDPTRVPANIHIFTLKYIGGIFVTEHFYERLRKANLTRVEFPRVRLREENQTQRKALLAKLAAERRKFKPKKKPPKVATVEGLQRKLGVTLPARAAALYRTNEERVFDSESIFDLSEAVEATKEVRAWKELVWPKHLVCIAEDGRGGYWALDTSQSKAGDCPVLYFDHELASVDESTNIITPKLELAAKSLEVWIKTLRRGGDGLPKSAR